jgi:hypothetical protein
LAQAEPDRADYQRDLAVSLVKIGLSTDDVDALSRGLAVRSSLKANGRLDPADLPMLQQLERAAQGR